MIDGFAGIGTTLTWFCDPTSWAAAGARMAMGDEGAGGAWGVDHSTGALTVCPPSKKDFWRKTYYTPILCKDDGPCLFATVPIDQTVTMETSFTLDPKKQFDQAGLCVRLDHAHWMKTGIEFVDGMPRLSCVVTNGYSDWSTQSWPTNKLCIRVHKIKCSLVVEAKPLGEEGDWAFIRIAHMSLHHGYETHRQVNDGPAPPTGMVWMGVFACCPEEQAGSSATFHSFTIRAGTSFDHNADGNATQHASSNLS